MNKIITVTKEAGKKLLSISKKHNTNKILFYVEGGGCNGFNYKFKPFFETPHKLDEIISYEDINIIVCKSSIFHLFGTKIKYKNDIMGSNFEFENPNANSMCGCVTSFSIK